MCTYKIKINPTLPIIFFACSDEVTRENTHDKLWRWRRSTSRRAAVLFYCFHGSHIFISTLFKKFNQFLQFIFVIVTLQKNADGAIIRSFYPVERFSYPFFQLYWCSKYSLQHDFASIIFCSWLGVSFILFYKFFLLIASDIT